MGFKVGRDCSVRLGVTTILGMGTWSMSGVVTDLLEDTEFGDQWKTYMMGLKDGGEITFNGLYDPADATGQTALITACNNATSITDLRLYVDNTSYWVPTTSNPLSFVYITKYQVEEDKAALGKVTFTAKISGKMQII